MHELLMSQLSLFEEELHKENCPPVSLDACVTACILSM